MAVSEHWNSVNTSLRLFRYEGLTPISMNESQPILMVHGPLANHESWDTLAEHLWQVGANHIYAMDVPEIQEGSQIQAGVESLTSAVSHILAQQRNAHQVVLIGYGIGGTVGYRYWLQLGDEARLSFLIMIGAPHANTSFSYLAENIVSQPAPAKKLSEVTNPIEVNRISLVFERSSTVVLNIFGNGVGTDFDGAVRGLPLPEAVNFVADLRHEELIRDKSVMNFMTECLRGKRYQLKLKLVGLQMRREDRDNLAGPIAFDIEGMRFPADTVFQPVVDRMYLFEDAVPALCTLSYPITQVSCTFTLHLRDLSMIGGRRRRLYVRVHMPLNDKDSTPHTMQDSEGSDFLWKTVCQRMPIALGARPQDHMTAPIIRGI